MECRNHTSASECLLLGLSSRPEQEELIFGFFLAMYLVGKAGNLLIILAICSASHLHTPMYFFVSQLSLVDFCFFPATIPTMLKNIQTHSGHLLQHLPGTDLHLHPARQHGATSF